MTGLKPRCHAKLDTCIGCALIGYPFTCTLLYTHQNLPIMQVQPLTDRQQPVLTHHPSASALYDTKASTLCTCSTNSLDSCCGCGLPIQLHQMEIFVPVNTTQQAPNSTVILHSQYWLGCTTVTSTAAERFGRHVIIASWKLNRYIGMTFITARPAWTNACASYDTFWM